MLASFACSCSRAVAGSDVVCRRGPPPAMQASVDGCGARAPGRPRRQRPAAHVSRVFIDRGSRSVEDASPKALLWPSGDGRLAGGAANASTPAHPPPPGVEYNSALLSLAAAELESEISDAVPEIGPLGIPRSSRPRHVALIMDGNLRWAAAHDLPGRAGHQRGGLALRRAVACCQAWGIPALTAFAFSTDNWRRPAEEVTSLLALLETGLGREIEAFKAAGVRLRFAGDASQLPRSLRVAMDSAVECTSSGPGLVLTLAVSYGGRQDIVAATRRIAEEVAAGTLRPGEITEAAIARRLATHDDAGEARLLVGDPDLLIRTSGERRVSNFLLWQMAYTELYFTDTLWPDFGEDTFRDALRDYAARTRRYGAR